MIDVRVIAWNANDPVCLPIFCSSVIMDKDYNGPGVDVRLCYKSGAILASDTIVSHYAGEVSLVTIKALLGRLCWGHR